MKQVEEHKRQPIKGFHSKNIPGQREKTWKKNGESGRVACQGWHSVTWLDGRGCEKQESSLQSVWGKMVVHCTSLCVPRSYHVRACQDFLSSFWGATGPYQLDLPLRQRHPVCGQTICHFPRALPASIWGHCSQVLVFTIIWGTHKKRGLTRTLFVLFFPASGYLEPQNTAKQGKHENDKSTLFYPPTANPSPL